VKVLFYTLSIGMIALICGHPFLYVRAHVFLFLGPMTGLAIVWCVYKENQASFYLFPRFLKAALCVWCVSCLCFSISIRWEWHALFLFFIQIIFLIAGYLLRQQEKKLYKMVWVISVGTIFLGIYSWLQFFEMDPLPPVTLFRSLGRVVATFENPNHLGNFFACVLCVVCAVFFTSISKWQFIGRLGICNLCYTGVLLTGSRGAWIAALFGVFILMVGMQVKGKFALLWHRYVVLVLPFVVITWLFSDLVMIKTSSGSIALGDRLLSTEQVVNLRIDDRSISHRLWIWNLTWKIIKDAPIVGHGLGTFGNVFTAFRMASQESPTEFEDVIFAHNEFLHLWVEQGFVGVVTFFLLVTLVLCQAIKRTWRAEGTCIEVWGAIGIVGGMLVHSMVSYPLHLEANSMLFWLSLGSLIGKGYQT
jgi:O-antigen ligase